VGDWGTSSVKLKRGGAFGGEYMGDIALALWGTEFVRGLCFG